MISSGKQINVQNVLVIRNGFWFIIKNKIKFFIKFKREVVNNKLSCQCTLQDLPKEMHLDGELFGGRGQFQSTVSIVKNAECDDYKKIKYHVCI